ncbi:hypothetical protein [Aliivibrio kagoshimensis]
MTVLLQQNVIFGRHRIGNVPKVVGIKGECSIKQSGGEELSS